MTQEAFHIVLAVIGLTALVCLVVAAVYLAKIGHPLAAAFAGGGAVTLAVTGLFRLLTTLGQPA